MTFTPNLHGDYSIETLPHQLRLKMWGAWNQQASEQCTQHVFREVDNLKHQPWVFFVDLLEWELTSPEVLAGWDPSLAALLELNLRAQCIVCDSKLCEFLMQKHQSRGDSNHQLTCGFFDDFSEAETWVLAQISQFT